MKHVLYVSSFHNLEALFASFLHSFARSFDRITPVTLCPARASHLPWNWDPSKSFKSQSDVISLLFHSCGGEVAMDLAGGCGQMLGQLVLLPELTICQCLWELGTLTDTAVFVPGQALAGVSDRLTWCIVNSFDYEWSAFLLALVLPWHPYWIISVPLLNIFYFFLVHFPSIDYPKQYCILRRPIPKKGLSGDFTNSVTLAFGIISMYTWSPWSPERWYFLHVCKTARFTDGSTMDENALFCGVDGPSIVPM